LILNWLNVLSAVPREYRLVNNSFVTVYRWPFVYTRSFVCKKKPHNDHLFQQNNKIKTKISKTKTITKKTKNKNKIKIKTKQNKTKKWKQKTDDFSHNHLNYSRRLLKIKNGCQYFGPAEIKDNPAPFNDFYVQCTHFFFSYKQGIWYAILLERWDKHVISLERSVIVFFDWQLNP